MTDAVAEMESDTASPERIRRPGRTYMPPTVAAFPVEELVKSGGGSFNDAFGTGHVE